MNLVIDKLKEARQALQSFMQSQGLAVNLAPNNTAELPLWTSMKKFDFGLISGVFKRREPACRALLALV
jgi:hypothetical protein